MRAGRSSARGTAAKAVLVLGCAVAAIPATVRAGDIEISGMTFVASRDSQTELVVWAESARVGPEARSVQLEQIHVTISGAASRPAIELRCERGEVDLQTNAFRLEGDVRGRTEDGRRFETEWLDYDDARALLYTDARVLISEPSGRYESGGLRYEVDSRRLRLLSGVRVVREP